MKRKTIREENEEHENLKKTDESIDYVEEFLGHARDGPVMLIAGNEKPEMELNEGQTFIASHFFAGRECVKIMESIGENIGSVSMSLLATVVGVTCRDSKK